ncbi:MAG TPA: hypothetical protein VK280_15485 [Streptosporangiaceae bacterium]|nr:hypothetical protein [Streptosporangiaceae bacterium]
MYWRRRAAILAAGLGLLGLLAWAFSGGGGKPAAPAAQGSPPSGTLSAAAYPGTPASSQSSPASSPSSPASSPFSPASSPFSPASASAGANAAVPGLASPGTSGLPTVSSSANSKPARSTARSTAAVSAAASAKPGGHCSPGSVVLSLFSSSRSYPAGQDPEFGVDAVSTGAGTCTFDLSPARLHLVVMSAGRVIWDSTDCLRGGGAQLSRLTRGVPVEEFFTWNRAITLPGCVTLATSARPGSYAAQARTASVTSGIYSFRLVR